MLLLTKAPKCDGFQIFLPVHHNQMRVKVRAGFRDMAVVPCRHRRPAGWRAVEVPPGQWGPDSDRLFLMGVPIPSRVVLAERRQKQSEGFVFLECGGETVKGVQKVPESV